jgi:hypothetical protein
MSRIPNSAMPHAVAEEEGDSRTLATRAADLVREHPRTAIAAGALAAAGIAAAIPLARRGSGGSNGSGGNGAESRAPARRAKKKA